MTVENVRCALSEHYNKMVERYKELLKGGGGKTKNSQAVQRHAVKKNICICELILELADKLDAIGHGKDELVRDDSLLGARFLLKKSVLEIEEYN